MIERKVAFFDIDKTIYDGFTIFPLAQHQVEKAIIQKSCFDDLIKDAEDYKGGKIDYESTIERLN